MKDKLRVLIVDDSLVYRTILTRAVEDTGLGNVIYTASNGEIALERLEQSEIDVILLDIYMPGIDGIETLKLIKGKYPDKTVIVISSGGPDSAELTVEALEIGAMDFILKPSGSDMDRNRQKIKGYLHILFAQILTKRYSEAFKGRIGASTTSESSNQVRPATQKRRQDKKLKLKNVDLVLIASSTGGPVALEKIIGALPSYIDIPILIVQHMPPTFTKMLAQTLDRKSDLDVVEGSEGIKIDSSQVILAPGGIHMTVENKDNSMVISLEDTPPVHGVKPAADVLFSSVARMYRGDDILAIVLTGMGSDGAEGIAKLKRSCNCYCITQSEDSCVVYGMPKSVYDAGLSDEVIHIDKIAGRIIDIVTGGG